MSQLGNPANVNIQQGAMQGGGLNFGSVPGANDYAGAYKNALSLNQQNYSNILSGYQQTAGRQQSAQQAIEGGYGNLYNTVLGGIQGIDASQRQAIRDTYAQQSGGAAQGLISRGLGNTTVQDSVQRGLTLDKQKADIALSNQTAQLQAGYQSNLGLAGLNYANQANMQNTALSGQQLNWMNSVNAPYPNAQAYGQLALQQGYANRAQQLYGQSRGGGGAGGGGGGGTSGLNQGFGIGGVGSFNPQSQGGGAMAYNNGGGPGRQGGGGGGGADPYADTSYIGGSQDIGSGGDWGSGANNFDIAQQDANWNSDYAVYNDQEQQQIAQQDATWNEDYSV